MKILITGVAGFIGFHLATKLHGEGYDIIGIDNRNDYYNLELKNARLEYLNLNTEIKYLETDICDKSSLDALFQSEKFDIVFHFAAQAGVRYSIEQPYKYIDSNLNGFINILEACRHYPVKHLFFASSSSVYGNTDIIPFKVGQKTDSPVSLYAATKKANELMGHSYSHLYNIPMTGLRFFTVYGPWGRPDMAYYSFTENIFSGKSIKLFNHGMMRRDFTFVDDLIEGLYLLLKDVERRISQIELYRVFNIGNNKPVELREFVHTLEEIIGRKANIEMFPMQDGDVVETYADIDPLREVTGFEPHTSLKEGLTKFVEWYKVYNKL